MWLEKNFKIVLEDLKYSALSYPCFFKKKYSESSDFCVLLNTCHLSSLWTTNSLSHQEWIVTKKVTLEMEML